jgi:hypothetical protein
MGNAHPITRSAPPQFACIFGWFSVTIAPEAKTLGWGVLFRVSECVATSRLWCAVG